MRPRHVDAYRGDARAVLASIGAEIGQDFHTLNTGQVWALLEAADVRRYRKPRNANGSRARYFYALLQRRARRWSGLRQFIREHRAELDAAIRRACSNVGTLNDEDREEWINNDEGLYNWARSEGVRL